MQEATLMHYLTDRTWHQGKPLLVPTEDGYATGDNVLGMVDVLVQELVKRGVVALKAGVTPLDVGLVVAARCFAHRSQLWRGRGRAFVEQKVQLEFWIEEDRVNVFVQKVLLPAVRETCLWVR